MVVRLSVQEQGPVTEQSAAGPFVASVDPLPSLIHPAFLPHLDPVLGLAFFKEQRSTMPTVDQEFVGLIDSVDCLALSVGRLVDRIEHEGEPVDDGTEVGNLAGEDMPMGPFLGADDAQRCELPA